MYRWSTGLDASCTWPYYRIHHRPTNVCMWLRAYGILTWRLLHVEPAGADVDDVFANDAFRRRLVGTATPSFRPVRDDRMRESVWTPHAYAAGRDVSVLP